MAAGTTLARITAGTVDWTFQTQGLPVGFATLAADEAVLLTAGPRLHLIDKTGTQVVAWDAEGTITAPAVVDADGRVIVAVGDVVVGLE